MFFLLYNVRGGNIMSNKDEPIQSIVNMAKIMDAINEKGQVGITDLSNSLNIPKSTVFRIIKSLEYINYVMPTDNDLYAISYKMLNYQVGIDFEKNLIQYAKKPLKEFSMKSGETINLAVKKEDKTYIIHSEEGEYYNLQSNMLPESDLYCSGTGKIFLCEEDLEYVRKYYDGNLKKRTVNTIVDAQEFLNEKKSITKNMIAYDHEEYEYGLTCIATSIKVDNKVIGAISVSGPTTRLKYKGFKNLEKLLLETSKYIENNISNHLN